ncbi:MAG: hypothetical protein ACRC4W_01080 [Treponemataceae bacterium]
MLRIYTYILIISSLFIIACKDINYSDAYTVSIDSSMIGGVIEIASAENIIRAGQAVRISVKPAEGFALVEDSLAYYANGIRYNITKNYFDMPEADIILTASFGSGSSKVSLKFDREHVIFSESVTIKPEIISSDENQNFNILWHPHDPRIQVKDNVITTAFTEDLIEDITISVIVEGHAYSEKSIKLTHVPKNYFEVDRDTILKINDYIAPFANGILYIPDAIDNIEITKISEKAFFYNENSSEATKSILRSIKKIHIPYTIKGIGAAAFKALPYIEQIIISPASPPQGLKNGEALPVNVFQDIGTLSSVPTIFVVPDSSVEVYRVAAGWNEYANFMRSSIERGVHTEGAFVINGDYRSLVFAKPDSLVKAAPIPKDGKQVISLKINPVLGNNRGAINRVSELSFIMPPYDVQVVADQSKTAETRVTLDWQNGTISDTVTAQYNRAIGAAFTNHDGTAIPAFNKKPEKQGFDFQGYFTEKQNGTMYFDKNMVGKTWNISDYTKTLYAQWIIKTTIVTFNPNAPDVIGGPHLDTDHPYTFTYGEPFPSMQSSAPTREGYTFKGYWTVSASTGGREIYLGNSVQLEPAFSNWDIENDTLTVYARWE